MSLQQPKGSPWTQSYDYDAYARLQYVTSAGAGAGPNANRLATRAGASFEVFREAAGSW
jgi:hypothetical protein